MMGGGVNGGQVHLNRALAHAGRRRSRRRRPQRHDRLSERLVRGALQALRRVRRRTVHGVPRWPGIRDLAGHRLREGLTARPGPRRRARCCGPCRRTRRRGTARPTTSTRGRAARAGGTAPAGDSVVPPSVLASDRELQPGQAGQPHLGAQPQQPAGRRAPRPARSPARRRPAGGRGSRRPRRSPTPPTTRSEPAADRPGQRERVPAVLAADALDHPPQRLRRARRPRWRGRRRTGCRRPSPGRSAAGRWARRAPRRDDQRVATSASRILLQRQLDGRVEAEQPARAGRARTSAMSCSLADDLVAQRLDQRPGDRGRAPA